MEPRDGNGTGDSLPPKKNRAPSAKRAPGARKRSTKTVKSAEQSAETQDTAATTVREEAPQGAPVPARTEPTEANRSNADSHKAQQRKSGERAVDLESAHDGTFGERDADRAADYAADLKSWMDARDDRDHRGEVL